MSDAIPYKQIIDRVKSDIDWIAEQAYANGYNEAKLIYQNPNAESDYQRGLDDGKARNEDGCIGCRYDDGTTEHSPCNYCCNAYSNQWSAKPCSDEIKVGDEVRSNNAISDHSGIVLALSPEGNSAKVLENDGSMAWVAVNVLIKTGRHFNFLTALLNAMKEGAE